MAKVNPGFRTDGVENANSGVGGMRMHEGNGTVERHGGVSEVLKHISVVETVWLVVFRVFAYGRR